MCKCWILCVTCDPGKVQSTPGISYSGFAADSSYAAKNCRLIWWFVFVVLTVHGSTCQSSSAQVGRSAGQCDRALFFYQKVTMGSRLSGGQYPPCGEIATIIWAIPYRPFLDRCASITWSTIPAMMSWFAIIFGPEVILHQIFETAESVAINGNDPRKYPSRASHSLPRLAIFASTSWPPFTRPGFNPKMVGTSFTSTTR